MMKRLILLVFLCLFMVSCKKESDFPVLSGTIESTETDVNTQISANVAEILIEEGQQVSEGDLLMLLDAESENLNLEIANSALETAKIKLAELKSGARDEQLAQAEAVVLESEARLRDIKSGSRPEVISQAEAAAEAQRAKLNELRKGNDAEKIRQQEAIYGQALTAQQTAENNLSFALESFESAKALFETGAASKQQFDTAKTAYENANMQKKSADEQIEIAKAALDLVKKGASAEAISAQQALYQQALSNVQLLKNGATSDAIAAAEAQLEQAEANYELLKSGATDYVIKTAEQAVRQQELNVEAAKIKLSKYELRAPVSGVILYCNVEPGEFLTTSQIVATIQSVNDYFIKVYVPQKNIGQISLNQTAEISTSALPNQKISGTVVFKSPKAEFTPKNIETTEAKAENTVFEIKIKITDNIDKLSSGMTSNVYFR